MTAEVRVVVDALSVHFGGGATYLVEQLRALESVAPELDLRILAGPWNAAGLAGAVSSPVEVVRVRDGMSRLLWEQTVLSTRHVPGGVLYAPGGTAPLVGCRLPVVVALQNPNYFGAGLASAHNQVWNRRLRTWLLRRSTRQADEVVAVSESFGREVLADLPELGARLTVIPSGAPSLPSTEQAPLATDATAAVIAGQAFFLSLANDAPHKNLDLLVSAWHDAMRPLEPSRRVALVMAGHITAARRAEQQASVERDLQPLLVHLGAVTDRRTVTWLLRRARSLVTASTLESFGFTTLEAGSVGCPIIATDIAAHRETADGHATFVAPHDRVALADALRAAPVDPVRAPWTWAMTWADHATRLAGVLARAADRPSARVA
jgi:glycosyltransferase involved in cell wall biosynthesis